MNGIGYQSYKKQRLREGYTSTGMELAGNERYCVYWGRSHQMDHETGVTARSPLKFGRAKFTTALQRGRNQAGADFRIYGEIVVRSNDATKTFETMIAELYRYRRAVGPQGQMELYDFLDDEIPDAILSAARWMNAHYPKDIMEVNVYDADIQVPLWDKKTRQFDPVRINNCRSSALLERRN